MMMRWLIMRLGSDCDDIIMIDVECRVRMHDLFPVHRIETSLVFI